MSKLEVLWLSREVPWPLDSGDKIYSAKLCAALRFAGAQVVALGLRPKSPASLGPDAFAAIGDHWRTVDALPRSRLAATLSRRPLVSGRFSPAGYIRAVREQLRSGQYDAVVLDHYAMCWVLDKCTDLLQNLSVIHVSHDFETGVTADIARHYRGSALNRFFLRTNAMKTKWAEVSLAERCALIVAITDEDAALFERTGAKREPLVLHPGYDGPTVGRRTIDSKVPRRVVILGSNVWIAKQMNLVAFLEVADDLFASSGIELSIIGETPVKFIKRIQSRLKATTFRGFVSNLPEVLDACRLGIVAEPTGGGFKLKTLDYVFSRVPVAALEQALTGQPDSVKQHFIVSDDLESLAHAIVSAIDDFGRLNAMQDGAFKESAGMFSWQRNGERLFAAIADIATATRHARSA
jgi:glycosyltransferase involved in cell wall biosynthesis